MAFLCLMIFVCLFSTLDAYVVPLYPPSSPVFDDDYYKSFDENDDDPMLGDAPPHMELPVEKKEMVNKVIAALLDVNPEEMMSYVEDNVKDPHVKKAILTKKMNAVCHFKLCNLGKRRRR